MGSEDGEAEFMREGFGLFVCLVSTVITSSTVEVLHWAPQLSGMYEDLLAILYDLSASLLSYSLDLLITTARTWDTLVIKVIKRQSIIP